ncbi:Mitochondrial ubiquitin ligase activator of nfkb 1-A [Spatholobus suberectus]|nr:Mitochondrial ubiquitin ligase activator of nfkb 1-A [Spatholobus suberectus]
MEEESSGDSHVSGPSCSSAATPLDNPSSSTSPSTSQLQAEETNHEGANNDIQHNQQQVTTRTYWINISNTNPSMAATWNDVQSCITVLGSFWVVASFALALGICGSVNLQLGPYCSRLIKINSMLVQSIKVEQIDKPKPGLMLYGFDGPPPLDVKINWTEMYNASLPAKFQKQWMFYLNKDSQLEVFYSVKPPVASLSLVIAKGREGLVEWKEDPLFPNATMYWNIIYGSGSITQKIYHSFTYYVAVDNMNLQNVEVELNFTLKALLYNTTSTNNRCSLDNGLCILNLVLLESDTVVLTSPGPREGVSDEEMFDVNVSYEPRWIIYFTVSGVVAVLILLALKLFKMFQANGEEREGFQQMQVVSERDPLLPSKDDDLSSWGSSHESLSNEEEDLTMWLARNSMEGKSSREGETSNDLQHLCVICSDAPRDCFFLPCGHSAACFACATRIAAEACTCPICQRKLKKVRQIFTV